MIGQWMPWLIAISSVGMALIGNYFLQRKILTIRNKEKTVDRLVDVVTNINKLCTKYWKKNKHDGACSLKIRTQQKWFFTLLVFSDEKYKFVNKDKLDSQTTDLFIQATDGEFDSKERTKSRPDKCMEISKSMNEVIIELLRNKI